MIYMPKLILVTGNGRNIGKTTLVEALIKLLSSQTKVYGLKVVKLGESKGSFHGDHSNLSNGRGGNQIDDLIYDTKTRLVDSIIEENMECPSKDTARMVIAGAEKAWFIQSSETELEEVINLWIRQSEPDGIVVCESAILRSCLIPGVMVAIKQSAPWENLKDWGLPFTLANVVIEKSVEMPDYIKWAEKIINQFDHP